MGNLDKLRAYLGLVGGQQSFVIGQALKRLKEQDAEIDRLNGLLAEAGGHAERPADEIADSRRE